MTFIHDCARSAVAFIALAWAGCQTRPQAAWRESVPETMAEAYRILAPSTEAMRAGSDPRTLDRKVMAGYQGWFVAHDEGVGRGWTHYGAAGPSNASPRRFEPGHASIELWPEMSEFGPDERYATAFKHADGRTAEVFSSRHPRTIDRHFSWMEQYGIDGVFLQRFGAALRDPKLTGMRNQVLQRLRASAAIHGRTWAVMYDLSGMKKGEVERLIIEDWKHLVDDGGLRSDPAYQHHRDKPVVAVWGIGFNDHRDYTVEECGRLIDFLKKDPRYGGNTVLLGVPFRWRTQGGDSTRDPALQEVLAKADILSPWSVGRYRSLAQISKNPDEVYRPDMAWTSARGLEYMPVMYPGFSWHNLRAARGEHAPFDDIPRQRGLFFWTQGVTAVQSGARMLYLAMFDELDEGTALMKVTNRPPIGITRFLTNDDLAPDHYLWLSGKMGELLRGAPADAAVPVMRHL